MSRWRRPCPRIPRGRSWLGSTIRTRAASRRDKRSSPSATNAPPSLRGALATKQSSLRVCTGLLRGVYCRSRDALARNDGARISLRRLAVLGETGELAHDFGRAHQALFRRLPFLEEHDLHVRTNLRGLAVLADEIHQPIRLGELVVAEGDDSSLGAGIDLFDVGATAIRLDRCDLEQIAHLVRQYAEAIAQFGGEILDLAVGVAIHH